MDAVEIDKAAAAVFNTRATWRARHITLAEVSDTYHAALADEQEAAAEMKAAELTFLRAYREFYGKDPETLGGAHRLPQLLRELDGEAGGDAA